jgi:hypothetical protein
MQDKSVEHPLPMFKIAVTDLPDHAGGTEIRLAGP